MDDIVFDLDPDGEGVLRLVYHPDSERARAAIRLLGQVLSDTRVGFVWPEKRVERAAFRVLRKVFGSKGRVTDWTRRWRGRWIIVDARHTERQIGGTYPNYDSAVENEIRWSLASATWF
jgi:hypothetical protein